MCEAAADPVQGDVDHVASLIDLVAVVVDLGPAHSRVVTAVVAHVTGLGVLVADDVAPVPEVVDLMAWIR
jgi:hypothetical protein